MGLHMRNMASAGIKSWSTSVMALGQLQPQRKCQPTNNDNDNDNDDVDGLWLEAGSTCVCRWENGGVVTVRFI